MVQLPAANSWSLLLDWWPKVDSLAPKSQNWLLRLFSDLRHACKALKHSCTHTQVHFKRSLKWDSWNPIRSASLAKYFVYLKQTASLTRRPHDTHQWNRYKKYNYQHYFYYIYLCVLESVCRSENNLWLWGVCTLLPSEAWGWNSVSQAW